MIMLLMILMCILVHRKRSNVLINPIKCKRLKKTSKLTVVKKNISTFIRYYNIYVCFVLSNEVIKKTSNSLTIIKLKLIVFAQHNSYL